MDFPPWRGGEACGVDHCLMNWYRDGVVLVIVASCVAYPDVIVVPELTKGLL